MNVLFEELSDSARVWIYPSSRKLSDQEVDSTFQHAGAIPSEFDWYNHPNLFSEEYIYQFDELSLEGHIGYEPWSGSYWPKQKAGISQRWQIDQHFDYELLSR